MRVLLDTCVWGGAAHDLRAAGHDVVHMGERSSDPGDEEILAEANRDLRVLVTLDKDFGELAIVRGAAHSGIVRLVEIPARRQAEFRGIVLERYGPELIVGGIATVTVDRVRLRPARFDCP